MGDYIRIDEPKCPTNLSPLKMNLSQPLKPPYDYARTKYDLFLISNDYIALYTIEVTPIRIGMLNHLLLLSIFTSCIYCLYVRF